MSKITRTSRRELLLALGILAATGIGWTAWVNRPRSMIFEPIPNLPGWRQTTFEGVSTTRGGLSTTDAFASAGNGTRSTAALSPDRLCQTLFANAVDGKVPVAVFSDFFCPYCRTQTERLIARAEDPAANLAITWHELPLLGPASVIAARAAVAADLQGRYSELQARMMGSTFRPTPSFLIESAIAERLDTPKFVSDIEGPIVAGRLARSRAAARTLGIYGTPALVIGRTLVIGEINDKDLDELLQQEAGTPANC